MKKYLVVMMLVGLMFAGCASLSEPAEALEMPTIEGEFMYLFRAKVLTLGAGATAFDFKRDDSANEVTVRNLPRKLLNSSSLKVSAAWTVSGKEESNRNGILPDYGGLKASIDLIMLAKNLGANVNTEMAITFDAGLFVGVSKLFENPSELDLQPAAGLSLRF